MMPNEFEAAAIRFEEREDILYAFVSGAQDSLPVSLDFWRRCIDECQRRSLKKLLVEEDFPNQLSTYEIFTLASAIGKMMTTYLCVAFVDRNLEHDDLNMFGETVAANRGAQGRVFNDFDKAVAWLESN